MTQQTVTLSVILGLRNAGREIETNLGASFFKPLWSEERKREREREVWGVGTERNVGIHIDLWLGELEKNLTKCIHSSLTISISLSDLQTLAEPTTIGNTQLHLHVVFSKRFLLFLTWNFEKSYSSHSTPICSKFRNSNSPLCKIPRTTFRSKLTGFMWFGESPRGDEEL